MNGRYKVHWERDEPKKKKHGKSVVAKRIEKTLI
jgi:hypothetical protein